MMGRLLKRKTSVKKKKKQSGDSLASSGGANGDNLKNRHASGMETKGEAKSSGSEVKRSKSSGVAKSVSGAHKKSFPLMTGDGYLGRSLQFLREVKAELKKVTWPSRKQTVGSTAVVIVLVMIISVFLGVVDLCLSSLVRMVLQ